MQEYMDTGIDIDISEMRKSTESLLDYIDEDKYLEEQQAKASYNYMQNIKVNSVIKKNRPNKPMYNSKKNMRH